MSWYSILFTICLMLLLIQTILNLVGFELDFDLDIDSGDFMSFKGLIHFLFGFSLTLTIYNKVTLITLSVASFVGIVSTMVLYAIYTFLYNKLKEERTYTNVLDNVDAVVIYYDSETKRGEIKVSLPEGVFNLPFTNKTEDDLKTNNIIKVSGDRMFITYKK